MLEGEVRHFDVYQADTSIKSSMKLVQNLRLDEFQVPFWAAYIDERRLDLNLQHIDDLSLGPSNYYSGNNGTNDKSSLSIYLAQVQSEDIN